MAPASEPQWPPRSPREALLSTPSGRQRYRNMLNRTSPSPSPSRKPLPMPVPGSSPGGRGAASPDEDDDEDEETLQLKLQEIQARLRLKKLQNSKNKENSALQKSGGGDSRSYSAAPAHEPRPTARGGTPGADDAARLAPRTQVQVPASPVRKILASQQQTSPSRVLLGIDKGLKAKDVSLKRAPSKKSATGGKAPQSKGYLECSRSSNLATAPVSRPPSFNERLAATRMEESFRAQRQQQIQKVRTNAFGIGRQEIEGYKQTAVDLPDEPLKDPTFSRDDILSKGKPSGQLSRSKTTSSLRSHSDAGESSSFSQGTMQEATSGDAKEGEESSSFEPYSCFHLSRRILPHRVLARHVSGKKPLNIKELLRDVKAPDFTLPDFEQDIVVFAIVAKKSEPRAHKTTAAKNGLQDEERGKYMVMTLCDLDMEVDLFLFNSGFTRFWKLAPGTVVAILNPGVMPPPPGRQDTGRFSLVINSDEDTILEIGSARDLGSCQSVRKDGDLCSSWVNKKRTHFCEFHSNEAIRKQRSTRVEVNSSGFGDRGRRQTKDSSKEWNGKKSGPDNYDWDTKTQWFTSRSYSAADLIDGKDRGPADSKEKKEFLKRNLEAKEKERELMKTLGRIGNAAGKEYMQRGGQKKANDAASGASSQALTLNGNADEASKLDLGLHSKGRTIHLSPIKRKRPEGSQASSTVSSATSSAYGWGGNLRNKLSGMKDGEKLHKGAKSKSPVRKKTRFVTEKGIREAGRESLGTDLSERRVVSLDDDDDELVIVK
ncbi:DNA replication licensing factor mcm10 [Tolypocladium capitatum]|uniref:DNA replication licensing factor mcm10 n=1 Tax=Tolypocladium capitatum TaxID=45235 RepID=A0A2K3QIX1_9HYPO|nr:DNA replication licensing factor mcm10 [Tolypocladium capitatum]